MISSRFSRFSSARIPCAVERTAISPPSVRSSGCPSPRTGNQRITRRSPTLRRSRHADLHPAHDADRPGRADAALESRPAARGEPRRRGARREGPAPVGDARPVRLRERRRGPGRRDDRPRLGRARRPRQREAPDDGRARDRRLPEFAELTALAVNGLAKRYGAVEALAGVDLEVAEGELVGLLGPNGAGKSTLTKIACGLVRPSAGAATVCGAPAGSA